MEAPLLAAVLIVKDEEENLPDCLSSLNALRPVLGEVIVYDTGSSDRTREVAHERGATVVEGYWDSDFARARNDAAAHATAKWVLSIDADERVVADRSALGALLRRGLTAGMVGWDIVNVTILDVDEHGGPLARHPFCKLFRPARARWSSPIHETLVGCREGRPVVTADAPEDIIYLRHHGYAQAATRHKKANRNAGVARAALAAFAGDAPDARAKLLADEARSLGAGGDSVGASARYAEALAVPGIGEDRMVLVVQDAVAHATASGRYDEAAHLIDTAAGLGADTDVLQWLRANLFIEAGRPADALPLLRTLRTVRLGSTMELDGSIAVATLMDAAIAAGEFDEALACAIQLVGSTGDVDRYGPQLLRLWGGQRPALLAELLGDVVGRRREAVADGLTRLPDPGPTVGRALRRAASAAEPTSSPRAGSAFFA